MKLRLVELSFLLLRRSVTFVAVETREFLKPISGEVVDDSRMLKVLRGGDDSEDEDAELFSLKIYKKVYVSNLI
jgi:hypothetical protein